MNGPASNLRPAPPCAPALLVLGALVAYANSFTVPFVFDDLPAIVDNPAIRDLGGTLSGGAGGLTLSGRPIVALSLALNYAISGYAVWSYHLVNLLVHVGSGLVLFGLLRRTLQRVGPPLAGAPSSTAGGTSASDGPTKLALAIAFLWTVHPLQTESVTYIVQRAESLMGFFYLLTLYAFARGTVCHPLGDKRPLSSSMVWLGVSVAACALGMITKEVMVTAPVLVLLYDRAFIAGTFAAAWRTRKKFYLALGATWLVLAYSVISTGGNRGGTVGFGVGVTPWAYALTQFRAIARYLALSFWPHPLVFDYGTFWVTQRGEVLPYVVIVAPLIALTIWALWRRPALGFAGAWFFGILAPTSLTPGTIQMIVEHRMYLSLAAVLALAVIGLQRWAGRAALAVCALAGLACVAVTVQRNATYHSELALWTATVAERPANSMAQNNLGLALFKLGRMSEATEHYERAVRADAHNLEARYNLALALARLDRLPAAFENYREVLRLKPDFAEARNNYGSALLKADRVDEARAEFQAALKLKPHLAEAHFNLGNLLAQQDHMAEALAHYEGAVQSRPDYVDAHINAGNALLQLDRVAEAVTHYEAALRLDPASPDAHNNLGTIFLHTGRPREAIPHFERALAARPEFPDAQRNLAEARAQLRGVP